jgi:hypothetical protein
MVFLSAHPLRYDIRREWMGHFGELVISQVNALSAHGLSWPMFLLQYADGFCLDAQFAPWKPCPMSSRTASAPCF